MTTSDLDRLLAAVRKGLGAPSEWALPIEFPDSLALCALNSTYSLRGGSQSVRNVLARYRAARSNASRDSGPDLLAAMDAAGGPEQFALDVLENRSVLPGTLRLRTVGIHEGLTNLRDLGVRTAEDLRSSASDPATRRAWVSVVGIGDLGWSFLLMNAGVGSESKPDVMVQRFVSRALGGEGPMSTEQTRDLLRSAAENLGVEVRSLDRAIWLHESPQG